jgi:hypothetical protein
LFGENLSEPNKTRRVLARREGFSPVRIPWKKLYSRKPSHENSVLSAYQEKIPARNAIYAHAQDFAARYELLLAILKAFVPLPLNKQQTIGFRVF